MLTLLIPTEGTPRELALVGDQVSVGRSEDNDVVLTHIGVSRRHLRLTRLGWRWFVEDLGSAAGLFVNDLRTQRHELKAGDRLRVGGYPHVLEVLDRQLDPRLLEAWARLATGSEAERLVHADALEMEGQLAFATWVRAEMRLHRAAPQSGEFYALRRELEVASKDVLPWLRALASRGPVEGCERGGCRWETLPLGATPRERECAKCSRVVTWCDTVEEARQLLGSLVVVDEGRARRPGDIRPMPMPMPVG